MARCDSDGEREVVECRPEPVMAGDFGGDVVVAAAEILDEGMTGSQDPRGAVTLQAPHRPQPGFQPPVVCLDRVVRVLLNGVQRRGDQLIEHPRVDRGTVGRDLGRDRAGAQRPGEEAPLTCQVPAGRSRACTALSGRRSAVLLSAISCLAILELRRLRRPGPSAGGPPRCEPSSLRGQGPGPDTRSCGRR